VVNTPETTYGYIEGPKSTDCPDRRAFEKIVESLKSSASAYSGLKQYTTGAITDVVYGVEGGMEDWGYGVGWENQVNEASKKTSLRPIRFNC